MSDPITVLLVDDHEMVRRGVRDFLETQGDITVVAEAGSGEEAVRLAAEHAPDVALMDLIMPGMDGVEATRRDRKSTRLNSSHANISYAGFWLKKKKNHNS